MCTRWNRLGQALLTSNRNLCFEQKYENIRIFIWKISFFIFFVCVCVGGGGGGGGGGFSVYLNRCIFIMANVGIKNICLSVKNAYLLTYTPNKASISLCICAVWSEPSYSTRKERWILSYPNYAKWRFWSGCPYAHTDLNLRWTQMSEGTFSDIATHQMKNE